MELILVRATDVLPINGVVIPSSKSKFLLKPAGTNLTFAISDLLQENDNYGFFVSEEETERFFKDMYAATPYSSEYSSVICSSINAIVPEDTFHASELNYENRPFIIVEPLKYHINDNLLSLTPYEAIIKGPVNLSKEAVLFVDITKTDVDFNHLNSNLRVINCNGNLREMVANYFKHMGYPFEELDSYGRYKKSETSELVDSEIQKVNENYGIDNKKHKNTDIAKEDRERTIQLGDYYDDLFISCFTEEFNFPNEYKKIMIKGELTKKKCEIFKQMVKFIGMDKYLEYVDKYNKTLLEMKERDLLPSNEEIISNNPNLQDLVSLGVHTIGNEERLV